MHRLLSLPLLLGLLPGFVSAAPIEVGGVPVELSVNLANGSFVRVTTIPVGKADTTHENPAFGELAYPKPAVRLREIDEPVTAEGGALKVRVTGEPLTIEVSRKGGGVVQSLTFDEKGNIRFPLDGRPVLGLGEGGPRTPKGKDWRKEPVEFDRLGRLHRMEPRWQSEAYGSRNPVALLVGTGGWGLYFASPWGQVDLSEPDHGRFLPIEKKDPAKMRQNHANQGEQRGKGIPPMERYANGLRDVFIFDASEPRALMKNLSMISGQAVLPPKWALGYMQSHRTLEDDGQMVGIVDTFRRKKIPMDAVIYLGTGFTPRGWNKPQPSFEFNPEVFKRDPREVVERMHQRHAKVVLHMVPWDRDRIPVLDASRLKSYWQEHEALVKTGVDGWWPDEGDWFDLDERMMRHRLYYEGPISTQPDRRPWSLHRNGHLGVARWGGWVWSGDTQSAWKSLEAQIAVGINHSLSLSPYWGSDIGGFFSTPELTGELYARWFQFGAFCPSFRSHGRTWWTRLPWGWGLDTLGPVEDGAPPDKAALNDPEIEKVTRRYAQLRYRLLTYASNLAWEARETGMPMMRALWLHFPEDRVAAGIGDEYLWGSDLLIAPVYEKGAKAREVYLPEGTWYDFWTKKTVEGGSRITREVDLATMPIYVRAGAVVPVDPLRQYSSQPVDEPLTIRVYPGADGEGRLYGDDGSNGYLEGESSLTMLRWDDSKRELRLEPVVSETHRQAFRGKLRLEVVGGGDAKDVDFSGEAVTVAF